MPIFVEKGEGEFQPYQFTKEADFEKLVIKLSDKLFGEASIYVDIKRRVKGNTIISIPDGYLIDFADPNNPRLFIVENEIVSHDPFKHIGNQILRFVVSFQDAQKEIRGLLMEEIQKNKSHLKKLEEACKQSKFRNIDDLLNTAVFSDFRGLVVIDEIRPELNSVLNKIRANVNTIELKTFLSKDSSFCYQYNTLYEEFDDESNLAEGEAVKYFNPEDRKRRLARKAKSDTIVVPAQEEGFRRVFLGENRWYAIRIGAAMKDRIKYIAAYQVAPVSGVTHIAEVKEIKPYKDSGKYEVVFKGTAQMIEPIKLNDSKYKPQGPVYVQRDRLLKVNCFDEAMREIL